MNGIIQGNAYFQNLHEVLRTMQASGAEGENLPVEEALCSAVSVLDAMRGNGLVGLVGNGGSAAIVAHMQVDLVNSVGVRAMVFGDVPTITALSNDYGYPEVYERQMRIWAQAGSVLVAVSSSGMSENILRAARVAREGGMTVITMSGFTSGNALRALGDINFYVASESYGMVELAHSCLAHYLTDQASALACGLGERA